MIKKRKEYNDAMIEADGTEERLAVLSDAINDMTDHYESILRKVLEALELREINKLLDGDPDDIYDIVRHLTYLNKKAYRRNDKLQAELKESYSRRDMMEFAEYVGRLYTLTGKSYWSRNDEETPADERITPNDILNYYERDKEMDSLPGKDDVDIKKGFDGSSLSAFIYD